MNATANWIDMTVQEQELLEAMERYIQKLKDDMEADPEQARKDSLEALYRIGVVDETGKPKERIVTWE